MEMDLERIFGLNDQYLDWEETLEDTVAQFEEFRAEYGPADIASEFYDPLYQDYIPLVLRVAGELRDTMQAWAGSKRKRKDFIGTLLGTAVNMDTTDELSDSVELIINTSFYILKKNIPSEKKDLLYYGGLLNIIKMEDDIIDNVEKDFKYSEPKNVLQLTGRILYKYLHRPDNDSRRECFFEETKFESNSDKFSNDYMGEFAFEAISLVIDKGGQKKSINAKNLKDLIDQEECDIDESKKLMNTFIMNFKGVISSLSEKKSVTHARVGYIYDKIIRCIDGRNTQFIKKVKTGTSKDKTLNQYCIIGIDINDNSVIIGRKDVNNISFSVIDISRDELIKYIARSENSKKLNDEIQCDGIMKLVEHFYSEVGKYYNKQKGFAINVQQCAYYIVDKYAHFFNPSVLSLDTIIESNEEGEGSTSVGEMIVNGHEKKGKSGSLQAEITGNTNDPEDIVEERNFIEKYGECIMQSANAFLENEECENKCKRFTERSNQKISTRPCIKTKNKLVCCYKFFCGYKQTDIKNMVKLSDSGISGIINNICRKALLKWYYNPGCIYKFIESHCDGASSILHCDEDGDIKRQLFNNFYKNIKIIICPEISK